MTVFTEADFNGWRFNRDAVHINGGSAFFGHGHRCVDQPRLLVIDKFFRKTRSSVRSYIVDGTTPCATLGEALAALAVAPKPNEQQLALLRQMVGQDWFRPLSRSQYLSLAEMGLIEWAENSERACRLTPAGLACLEQTAAGDQ